MRLLTRIQIYLLFVLFPPSFFSSAAAISACDFLSGNMKAACRTAANASHQRSEPRRARPQQRELTAYDKVAARPATVRNPSQRQQSTEVQYDPQTETVFNSSRFYGLSTWAQAFDKEVRDPKGLSAVNENIAQSGNGSESLAMQLFAGPERNDYQKYLTDYKLYKAYYRSAPILLARQNQCLVPRDYSPAEACDCVAGFPGDTAIGPGAGELVTGSNSAIGIRACGLAAEATTNPFLKARFTAQKARAQVYTYDVHKAAVWSDQAVAAGYKRASIVRALAELRTLEVLSGGFPGMTYQQIEESQRNVADALKTAKKYGVWETFLVAGQYQQTLQRLQFNDDLFSSLYKSMTAPPPPQIHSCARDGVPCAGQHYDDHGNVVNNN